MSSTPAPEIDRNELSWWLPRIEAAGVPVPRTVIVEATPDERSQIYGMFDGKGRFPGDLQGRLYEAANAVGWPVFMRTDHLSGKHEWNRTCYLDNPGKLVRNVMGLVEHNEMVDWFGSMPWNRFVMREFLPTMPVGKCPHYGDMPICREFRYFVDDGLVRCHHAYWPERALQDGGAVFDAGYDPQWFSTLSPDEAAITRDLVERAGTAVGGSWSIDVLETRRGWFVTDMALAHQSFHALDCDHRHDAPNGPEPDIVTAPWEDFFMDKED